MKPKVVVTGLGVLSPVGIGCEAFWSALKRGVVGTGRATRTDMTELCSDRVGEIHDLDENVAFRRLDAGRFERATKLAVAAARMAADDAALDVSSVAQRCGVAMGVVVANRPGLEPSYARLYNKQSADLQLARHDVAWVSEAPAIELGARGPVMVLPTACAAGNSALGYACDMIRNDRADVMLAGGADELSPAMLMMFSQFGALSPDYVRPFDTDRKGIILSEGAAVLVLENERHARARGAKIYSEVRGHGNFADAHDMTHPHPDGMGARLSMQAALSDAELCLDDVDALCAHGTGTPANDSIEARAIADLFGKHAASLPVTSLKSVLGHTQGAAGAVEAVACNLAIRDGVVPPTMNVREIAPECSIALVVNKARRQKVDVVLNNAFGFGGNISCVVFARSS